MQIGLAFCSGEGSFVKASYLWKVWGRRGRWQSCEVRRIFGVGLWTVIRRDWDVMGSNMVYSVGNDRGFRFWKDRWCADNPLRTSFPSLFAISLSKEVWVEDVWNHSRGGV